MKLAWIGAGTMLLGAAWVCACGGGDEVFGGGSSSSGSSASSSSGQGGAGQGAASQGGSGQGASGHGGSGQGGAAQGGSGQGGAAQGGSGQGGEGSPCPPEPGDDPCTTCMKAHCCAEGIACFSDPECSACLQCLETSSNPQQCFMGPCSQQDPETNSFFSCSQGFCAQQCM